MHWITDHLDHGDWQSPWFPSNLKDLLSGQSGAWRSESAGFMTGTEGWALFGIDVPNDDPNATSLTRTEYAHIQWDRPYVGNFSYDIQVTRDDPRNAGGSSVFSSSELP